MAEFTQVHGAGGAQHTFSEEEKMAFSSHINQCLGPDPVLARHLPLNVTSNDIFEKTNDGLILCKLINLAVPDTIDERALNKKENLNIYHKTENLNLALNAAKGIGCQVVNIGSQDLIEGRPILVLGLIWQIIKIQLMAQITLKSHPELAVLLEEGETMASFMKLPPEQILIRWVNYHMIKAGSSRRIANFSSDIVDCEVYSILTTQLNSTLCTPARETDGIQRASHVIRNAKSLGVDVFIQPRDICDGNKKLNISFVAQIFNVCPGLVLTEQVAVDLSALELDDAGDSREERTFRLWINSLNIDNLYVNDLFAEMEDGVALLKILDAVQPGSVNPKKINQAPKSRYKKVENANYAVDICKNEFKFSMINVGGLDIVDGKKKMILAIIWQLVQRYTMKMLSNLSSRQGISEMSEKVIVNWANEKVGNVKISSFKDSTLKNGVFLLRLIAAIEPRAVAEELITPGLTPEDQKLNARYSISCARKIGACVFLTPEDIVEGKNKMLFTFCASLWLAELSKST